MFFNQENVIGRSCRFFDRATFRAFDWSLGAANRSRSHVHICDHAGTSAPPPRGSRAESALTGGRDSHQLDLEDAKHDISW